jgi:hypothetical protein
MTRQKARSDELGLGLGLGLGRVRARVRVILGSAVLRVHGQWCQVKGSCPYIEV